MTELNATIDGKKGTNADIPVIPKYTVYFHLTSEKDWWALEGDSSL